MVRNGISNRRKTSGFTLLELLLVLAIIALLYYSYTGKGGGTKQSATVQSESSNVALIATKVSSLRVGRSSYEGFTTAYLLSLDAFPTSLVNVDGTSVVNAWQGGVTVAPGAGNTTVDITYTGVPSAACVEWVTADSRQYNEVTVGTTKTKNGAKESSTTAVESACTAAPKVNITFNTQ